MNMLVCKYIYLHNYTQIHQGNQDNSIKDLGRAGEALLTNPIDGSYCERHLQLQGGRKVIMALESSSASSPFSDASRERLSPAHGRPLQSHSRPSGRALWRRAAREAKCGLWEVCGLVTWLWIGWLFCYFGVVMVVIVVIGVSVLLLIFSLFLSFNIIIIFSIVIVIIIVL